jgi:hypothetical protein
MMYATPQGRQSVQMPSLLHDVCPPSGEAERADALSPA